MTVGCSQSINWLDPLRLTVCVLVEQKRTEKDRKCLTWRMAPHAICNTLVRRSYSITDPHPTRSPRAASYPSLGRYPLFVAPTQPFGGLWHLIHAEDDSRSAIWGVKAAEESFSLPLSTSIIQHLRLRPPLTPHPCLLSPSFHCFCCCTAMYSPE